MWEISEEHLPWVFLAFFSGFLDLILLPMFLLLVISLPPNIRLFLWTSATSDHGVHWFPVHWFLFCVTEWFLLSRYIFTFH